MDTVTVNDDGAISTILLGTPAMKAAPDSSDDYHDYDDVDDDNNDDDTNSSDSRNSNGR